MADNGKRAVDAYTVDGNGCWIWQGRLTWKGYGCIGAESRRAHREYYVRHVGPIPKGMMVLHRCDVKRCVNPAHLYLGTNADNMRDASERGQLRSPARQAAWADAQALGRKKSLEVRRANAQARRASSAE